MKLIKDHNAWQESSVAQLQWGQREHGQGPVRAPVPTGKCIQRRTAAVGPAWAWAGTRACARSHGQVHHYFCTWKLHFGYNLDVSIPLQRIWGTIQFFRANQSVRAPGFLHPLLLTCVLKRSKTKIALYMRFNSAASSCRSTRASFLTASLPLMNSSAQIMVWEEHFAVELNTSFRRSIMTFRQPLLDAFALISKPVCSNYWVAQQL